MTNEEKRAKRAKKTAEIFTPPHLADEMLAKLPEEVWEEGKTFLDNSCGNGNFLAAILERKLSLNHNPLDALRSVYGADIMPDNILECRVRLLKIIAKKEDITEDHICAVLKNIVWIDMSVNPTGSLEYDFSFNAEISKTEIDEWLNYINGNTTAEPPVLRWESKKDIVDLFEGI